MFCSPTFASSWRNFAQVIIGILLQVGVAVACGRVHLFCLAPLTHAAGYGAIINFVAKSGETLAAEGWIDRMQAAGVRADIASYNMDAGPEIACEWQVAGCIQRTTLSC